MTFQKEIIVFCELMRTGVCSGQLSKIGHHFRESTILKNEVVKKVNNKICSWKDIFQLNKLERFKSFLTYLDNCTKVRFASLLSGGFTTKVRSFKEDSFFKSVVIFLPLFWFQRKWRHFWKKWWSHSCLLKINELYGSNKSTEEETGKSHLCELTQIFAIFENSPPKYISLQWTIIWNIEF